MTQAATLFLRRGVARVSPFHGVLTFAETSETLNRVICVVAVGVNNNNNNNNNLRERTSEEKTRVKRRCLILPTLGFHCELASMAGV